MRLDPWTSPVMTYLVVVASGAAWLLLAGLVGAVVLRVGSWLVR